MTATADPTALYTPPERRLAALTAALGAIGATQLTDPDHQDTTALHTGLTELAAVTLGWLDALPDPYDAPPF